MSEESRQPEGYYINYPKQQRSLQRFNHILDIAAQLFAQQGYENVGTNHIAGIAEVSVGSFYRFFSGKDALVDALVERYISNLAAVLPQHFDRAVPMSAMVRAMLEGVFEFDRQHASFAQILTTTQAGQLAHAAVRMHITLRTWVEQLLIHYYPHLEAQVVHLCAAGGMGIVKGMLTMVHPPDSLPLTVVLDEMVATLMGYVASINQRFG